MAGAYFVYDPSPLNMDMSVPLNVALGNTFGASILTQGLTAFALAAHPGMTPLKRCFLGIYSVYHALAAYFFRHHDVAVAATHTVFCTVRACSP